MTGEAARDTGVDIAVEGGCGVITLNRPEALNALTLDMCHAIEAALLGWLPDTSVKAVIIRGAGRAFCAGGDIRSLYDSGLAGDDYPYRFYHDEYRLNALIHHYPKPYIALLNGIVMGGGVGVSVHGSHRVATENIRFAMPETGIGLFPDVGGSYFLSRCPGETGLFLALTGTRIGAADAVYTGIATDFVPADALDALYDALIAANFAAGTTAEVVNQVIGRFSQPAPDAPSLAARRDHIDRIFSGDSIDGILDVLAWESDEWAETVRQTILSKSPTSTKVAFRQIRKGATLDFDDCMQMEYRIASRFIVGADFYEGVRATVIDKDQTPRWQPGRLVDVDAAAVDAYFASLGEKELMLGSVGGTSR